MGPAWWSPSTGVLRRSASSAYYVELIGGEQLAKLPADAVPMRVDDGPEPGQVDVLARRADGTLTRWTARFINAGLISDFGQLCILGEAWHREVLPEYAGRPALTRCPACDSTQPHLHPSADLCSDAFHRPIPATVTEWRREAARWADLLDSMEFDAPGGTGAVDRLAAEIRREVRESGAGS